MLLTPFMLHPWMKFMLHMLMMSMLTIMTMMIIIGGAAENDTHEFQQKALQHDNNHDHDDYKLR